jgi:hypothetical protein
MDLRDQFAMHIATALVGALSDPEHIARRAYDVAEAMLAERARRIDAEERAAIAMEPRGESLTAPLPEEDGAFFGEPPAVLDEDEELEPPYDPTWDLEVPRSGEAEREGSDSERSRPGLARIRPPRVAETKVG